MPTQFDAPLGAFFGLPLVWPRSPAGVLASVQSTPVDEVVLISYYLVMAVLSVYGLHRLALVWLYYRARRSAPAAAPTPPPAELPRVTVQLPVYNERFVVQSLIEAACGLDYPRDRFEIQVLDDSTDETTAIAEAVVARYAAQGQPITFRHRNKRDGFKAGALRDGLAYCRGELVAIFDADFRPSSDFLLRTVGEFADPRVGVVQARWTYRNREESLLTRAQAMLLDGHFVFEQGARSLAGRFFNFNGTAGVLRREMIDDAGGWRDDTLTEDTDLSYRAQLRGWKLVYRPDVEVLSELPVDVSSFQAQQARWAKGLMQTALNLWPRIASSRIPLGLKAESWMHLTGNATYPLLAILAMLVGPTALIRMETPRPWLAPLDLAIFLSTFGSMTAFYGLAQKELFGDAWKRRLWMVPALLAVGVALTLSNARAVGEALLGVRSEFVRTAKYNGSKPATPSYRTRAGGLALANLLLGGYFCLCAAFALSVGAWAALPFMALFLVAFLFAGASGLASLRSDEKTERPRTV